MEIHQIRYFLAVVRERNFSRAAASCNVTQPALTRAIQKLEEQMGGQLFDRRPGRIELTELGRTVFPRLEGAYREVSEAKTQADSLIKARKSTLRLGLTCTIGPSRLIALVDLLRDRIPGLELSIREGKGQTIVDDLIADRIDAAIVGLPAYPASVVVVPLYCERYVVALPPGHRFEAQDEVRLCDLDGEPYLDRLHCEFDDHFAAQHGAWPIELNTRYASEREDWLQAMILAGLGCAIVPEFLTLLAGIETRRLIEPCVHRDVSILTVQGREQVAAVEILIGAVSGHDWRM